MKIVQIDITTTKAYTPDGVVAGKLRLTLTNADGTPALDINKAPIAPVEIDGLTADIANVASGSYVVVAQRLDSTGAPFGDAKTSAAFDVLQATADVPETVSVVIK